MIKRVAISMAALSLMAAPIAAQAAPLSDLRPSSAVSDENDLRGGFALPLAAIIAILIGILLATNGDDSPTSP